jgi:pilus assembly protein CpaB
MPRFTAALVLLALAGSAPAAAPPGPRFVLPVGHRAVALKLHVDTAVGGFVLPGSRVDVVLTERTRAGTRSRVILKDVLVVAVETKIVAPEGARFLHYTVTLAARSADVTRLALAASIGELRLVLRAPSP